MAEYWQEPDCEDQGQLREKFLGKLPLRGVCPFVLCVAGNPVGYFQYYEAQKVGGGWWPQAKPGTFGIDQFIGNPNFIGRGLGTRAIRKFAKEIFASTSAQEIIADPDPLNSRAINIYKKCGFVPAGEITTPGGLAQLMRLSRKLSGANAVRAILTDLDGVIRFFPAHRDSEIENRHGLAPTAISRIAFHPELLSSVITGKISDEAWREQIRRKLEEVSLARDSRAAVNEWSSYAGEVNLETLSLLRRLSPGPLALLTNATSRLELDLKKLGIWSHFDLILNSSELGVAKPALEVFRLACQKLVLPPEQILFIDDSATNIAAAKSVGLISLHFSGHEKMQEELKNFFGEI